MYRIEKTLVLVAIALQYGCMSSTEKKDTEADRFSANYSEAYDVYPAVGGSGVSKHLLRSHSTAILVRPASSIYELSNRLFDEVWDAGRRIEVRAIDGTRLGLGLLGAGGFARGVLLPLLQALQRYQHILRLFAEQNPLLFFQRMWSKLNQPLSLQFQ
jgi:hypothetical protein